jgi:transcriptional regulator with XRE-family HTH domain
MDDAPPPPIGRRIKRARERLRMTQVQLADSIDVTQKTIDNWEHDRSYPKSSIGALEDVLGVRLDEDAGDGRARTVSPDLRKLVAEHAGDDPKIQRLVIGLLEGTVTWPIESGPAAPAQPHEAEAGGEKRSAG